MLLYYKFRIFKVANLVMEMGIGPLKLFVFIINSETPDKLAIWWGMVSLKLLLLTSRVSRLGKDEKLRVWRVPFMPWFLSQLGFTLLTKKSRRNP